jgi:hypothetical protein
MTYWPISSPSVFAATKHTRPERSRVSHDGLDEGRDQARQDRPNGSSQSRSEAEETAVLPAEDEVEEKEGPRLLRQRASDQSLEDDLHGEIIAVRVTRSGHMFATLTQSTLTIWQTKARHESCAEGWLLIRYIAYGGSRVCLALRAFSKDIRPQYRHSPTPRLPNLRGADNTRLSYHLFPCDRPLFSRIQDAVHKHTRGSLKKE